MANDTVQIQSTGSSPQNIDNTSLVRPDDGVIVDRQRVTLKGDLDFQAPPLIELYLLELIELQRQTLLELKLQTYIQREMFAGGDISLDSLEAMRNDPSLNDLQVR